MEVEINGGYRFLAAAYGSQFVPLAFCLFALGALLRQRGIALELIAIVQLAPLAWVVKFAWARLVDRYGSRRLGHYRGWLIATQLAMVAGVLALIPLDVVINLPLVLAVVAFVAIVPATQDIAADATAVRLLAPTERGIGNGIQKAGGYLGLMIGGGAGLVLYDWWGWGPTLAVLAALTAIPLPMLLRYREPADAAPDPTRPAVSQRTLASFFQQPGAARSALAVLPAYLAAIALAYPPVNPLLVDAGWPLANVGAVSVIGGGAVAVVASLAAGNLLSTTGPRRALVGLAIAQAATISALVLAIATNGALLAMARRRPAQRRLRRRWNRRLHDQHRLEPTVIGRHRLHAAGLPRAPLPAHRGPRGTRARRCLRLRGGPFACGGGRDRRRRRRGAPVPGPLHSLPARPSCSSSSSASRLRCCSSAASSHLRPKRSTSVGTGPGRTTTGIPITGRSMRERCWPASCLTTCIFRAELGQLSATRRPAAPGKPQFPAEWKRPSVAS